MKKTLFMLLAALFFVACGNNSPEDIAKNFVESAYSGKVEDMVKCFEIKDNEKEAAKGKLSMMSLAAVEAANKKGGLKSIEIVSSDIEGNKATVTLKVKYKNNTESKENVRLYKTDKAWFVKL